MRTTRRIHESMRKERFEIKYFFPLERLDELMAYIRPFMRVDGHANTDDRVGAYRVRSLYLDSSKLDFFWSHVEGHPSRRKIRIRKYSFQDSNKYFLEIKNKVLMATNKYRVQLGEDLIKKGILMDDFSKFCDLFLKKHSAHDIAKMLDFDIQTLKIKPTLFVSYSRLALNSIYEYDIRMTVDFNIEVSKASDLLRLEHQTIAQRILPSYAGVLEIKSNRTIPRWLQDVLISFKLTRRAFSKYKEGIEKIYNP